MPKASETYTCAKRMSRSSTASRTGQGWIVKIEGGPSWINSDLFPDRREGRGWHQWKRNHRRYDAIAPRRPV